MKNIVSIVFCLIGLLSFSQGISIDTTSYSIPQLVNNILMPNSCADITNFQYSSRKGIGYFTNTNTDFPINNGIIIRSGIAKYTEGPYTGLNESSLLTTSGDVTLQSISSNMGQSAQVTDVSYLQFDFTPISNKFVFDFIFASNEYGQFQCGFSDVFAFLLTDLITGEQTNLSVVPNTTTPITVKSIRDNTFNPSCLSSNPGLFGKYNVDNPSESALNMKGETKLLSVTANVIPNRNYQIKLAVGDYSDHLYDSAVLISGSSFKNKTNLGQDRIICQGENILLDTGLGPQYNFIWKRNDEIIVGANSNSYNATQPGNYKITATIPNIGCIIEDEINLSEISFLQLNDLYKCDNGDTSFIYNLTQNNIATLGLNPSDYSISYYDNLENALNNTSAIPVTNLETFTSPGNQTIYIKITNITNQNTICENILSFQLLKNLPVSISTPENMNICKAKNGNTKANLNSQITSILNNQNPLNFNISFFTTLNNAQSNSNPITNPNSFNIAPSITTVKIWVRVSSTNNPECFSIVDFDIHIHPLPIVDSLEDVIVCESYTLPSLINGYYYTQPNGTGIMLSPGYNITEPGTYYIFNGPLAPFDCSNESSFKVTIIKELKFEKKACGEYKIQNTPLGNFYTGPNGSGNLLIAGSSLTNSQTIFYYAVMNDIVCREESLEIIVFPLPMVDNPANVITCNNYTLPPLTHGNYYTGPNGTGTKLNAGTIINTSTILYVYSKDENCSNQSQFKIDIIKISLYSPVVVCGGFKLPNIPFGNYYTLPNGEGTPIPPGTIITESQNVYYFANTTTSPNCTSDLNYQITVKPLPLVDTPLDVKACLSYTLPELVNGKYYTKPNGTGNLLSAGTVINSSQTLYIYNIGLNTCTNQHTFKIEIKKLPKIDSPLDIYSCLPYTLPNLTNGKYYTSAGGPNGGGNLVNPGTVINSNMTLYIYNAWDDLPSCYSETSQIIEINYVNVGNFTDIKACDSYTLPPLTIGKYYKLPNGQGEPIPSGTVITNSQTIYVFAEKQGTRFTCYSEKSFEILISKTPVLENIPDVEKCASYTLPNLNIGNYYTGPNGSGTKLNAGDIITSSQIIYVFASSPNNINCTSEIKFNVTIYPLKNLIIKPGSICVDFKTGQLIKPYILETGLNPNIFTVEWYLNSSLIGTGVKYSAIKEGLYNVIIIKKTPDTGNDCGYNPTSVHVTKSGPAVANIVYSTAFENVIDIKVNILGGYGDYQFQLDSGPFQDSNIFQDVESGQHIITIRDIKGGCNDVTLIANVLKFPKVFTPNSDGNNDSWNIPDLKYQPSAIIYVYDRFGKLIYKFKPTERGWDGTFNGQLLPSTDYWFKVYYKLNNLDQEYNGHFTLKR